MRNFTFDKTLKMLGRKRVVPAYRRRTGVRMLAALCFTSVSIACFAQQISHDVPKRDQTDKTTPTSPTPTDEGLPSGNPQTGVLKPPDVDPKMAKTVPDIDPAMDNAPPGKPPAPDNPDPPKVQPK